MKYRRELTEKEISSINAWNEKENEGCFSYPYTWGVVELKDIGAAENGGTVVDLVYDVSLGNQEWRSEEVYVPAEVCDFRA